MTPENDSSNDDTATRAQNRIQEIIDFAGEAKIATAAALSDSQSKAAEIAAVATLALVAKTQIADEQAVIATKSDHIQKAQEHADKVRADLDRALTNAIQQAIAAEGQRSAAQASATNAAEMLNKIRDAVTEADELTTKARAAAATLSESQSAAASALVDCQSKAAESAAVATLVLAAKTQITDEQAVIATKSDHIQKAQEHADKIRADLDRVLTTATQQATAAEGQKSAAQSSAERSAELLSDIRTAKGAAEIESTAIVASRKDAEQASAVAKRLAEKAQTVEERIAAYEKRLADFEKDYVTHLKKIVDLLPGATTVGLAHAFDERRQAFLKPATRWQWLFVGSVLAIVALTITALWHVFQGGPAPTYDELFRMWLARLPVMVALVWLALHASRESALARRLEEDYGYKSAVASCFEGFKKQMADVGTAVAPESALARLLTNTLETISLPPGRIYDKHELAVSPADEVKHAAKAAVEVANVVKP